MAQSSDHMPGWSWVPNTQSFLHDSGMAVVWQDVLGKYWFSFWGESGHVYDPSDRDFSHKLGPYRTPGEAGAHAMASLVRNIPRVRQLLKASREMRDATRLPQGRQVVS